MGGSSSLFLHSAPFWTGLQNLPLFGSEPALSFTPHLFYRCREFGNVKGKKKKTQKESQRDNYTLKVFEKEVTFLSWV